MIKVMDVVKHYGDFEVLKNISLNVRRGTIYGLVGPNGAGKTTVINHITGALRPEWGSVTVNEEEVWENPAIKERVLSISDEWFYYSGYTIEGMARFYRDMYPTFSTERYESLKELFGLDTKRTIRTLSKGQKKQVAFWLSLSAMPEVLVLDEPLDGLDPVMRKQVLNLVISDVAEREMTVLVSSHNLRELEDICDWVGIMHEGELLLEKPLDDLKGSVKKYQLSFGEDADELLENTEEVLHVSKTGSVYTLIVKGDAPAPQELFPGKKILFAEQIGLTLEEVFIYELGGYGYDIHQIIF